MVKGFTIGPKKEPEKIQRCQRYDICPLGRKYHIIPRPILVAAADKYSRLINEENLNQLSLKTCDENAGSEVPIEENANSGVPETENIEVL